jgi:hypothetical protein
MYPPVHRRRVPSGSPPVRDATSGTRLNLEVPEWASGARVVREDVANYGSYEAEGSERRTLGSINVPADARWQGELTVPIGSSSVMFVHLEREGTLPAGYRGSEERTFFSIPVGEADAVVALLAGLIAQARRDGVLT